MRCTSLQQCTSHVAKQHRTIRLACLALHEYDAFWVSQAALASGHNGEHADVVIQSTHKMLSALTQASMLHVKGRRAAHLSDRISRALQMLQVGVPLC